MIYPSLVKLLSSFSPPPSFLPPSPLLLLPHPISFLGSWNPSDPAGITHPLCKSRAPQTFACLLYRPFIHPSSEGVCDFVILEISPHPGIICGFRRVHLKHALNPKLSPLVKFSFKWCPGQVLTGDPGNQMRPFLEFVLVSSTSFSC